MSPVPEHWAFGLIPPAEHQIDLLATSINLQFKIPVGMALTIPIPAFDAHIEFIQLRRG